MEDEVFDISAFIKEEQDFGKVIAELQNGRLLPLPDYAKYIRQLDPREHDVMDPRKRPNKVVNVDPSSADYGQTRNVFVNSNRDEVREGTRIEEVTRTSLALQDLIVRRAVGITFGNRVKYKATPENEQEKALYAAVKRVMFDVKEQTLNREAAGQLYGMTEVAERWYVTQAKDMHTNYSGRGTKSKIRCVVLKPENGDRLYPYFDDNRDLAAFSRQFMRRDRDGAKRVYFETLTADTFYLWACESDESGTPVKAWQLVPGYPKPNPFGKIPVIYGCQKRANYEIVETIIARMEKLLSNFGDTNDYHGSPKVIAKGRILGFAKKGEAGGILEVDPDADVKYLEWSHAPESVKTEYTILKELVHMLTQTPDISWDSVKGLNVSGVALELMFMDATLMVKEKERVWADYLQRRVNLVTSMLTKIDPDFVVPAAKLLITPEITPFIVEDKQQKANTELSLAGNKQLKSQRTAMVDAGVENPDEELELIKKEEQEAAMFDQGEPTFA